MCLVLGSSGAGKTLLLKRLQACTNRGSYNDIGDPPSTIPTVGTNLVNVLNLKKQEVTVRELGGAMAPIWHNYFPACDALVFVADSANRSQISAMCIQLLDVLTNPKLKAAPILLLLNKTDMPNAVSRVEFESIIRLTDIIENSSQKITILETSARSGKGLQEVGRWISDHSKPN